MGSLADFLRVHGTDERGKKYAEFCYHLMHADVHWNSCPGTRYHIRTFEDQHYATLEDFLRAAWSKVGERIEEFGERYRYGFRKEDEPKFDGDSYFADVVEVYRCGSGYHYCRSQQEIPDPSEKRR